jgi:hypothetical protein
MKRESALHVVAAPKRKKDTRVGLMNPEFVYVKHEATDIRKTFERIRAELAKKGAR